MAPASLSRGSPSQQAQQIMEYGKITLSELLMEQQEPFLLEEYLKQNGYSRRVPKIKCHPQRSGLCGSLSVCKKLLKRRSSSSRGTNAGGGTTGSAAPRSILNKMMYRKVISRLMNWGCGRQQMEFRRLDSLFEKDYNNGEEHDWGKMEVMTTSRQLSPVSVFELHSDNEEDSSSPTYHYNNFEDEKMSTSSRDSEGEASHQVSNFSPIKNNCTNMEPNGVAKDVVQEMIWEPQEGLRSQMSSKQAHEQVLSWEKIARDINQIPNLIEIDFSRSEKQWCQVKRDMAEIGGEIETLIFEDIRKEAVLDLLGFGSHCTL